METAKWIQNAWTYYHAPRQRAGILKPLSDESRRILPPEWVDLGVWDLDPLPEHVDREGGT